MKPASPGQLAHWTVRYLDDDLQGEDLERLQAALREDAGARRIFDEISQQAFAFAEPAETPSPARSSRRPAPGFLPASLAGFGLAALLFIGLFISDRMPGEPPVLARALVVEGRVALVLDPANGVMRFPRAGDEVPLREGQMLRLNGPDALVEILYRDGTRLSLSGVCRARCEQSAAGGKRVVVASGEVAAEVVPQPAGRPLVLETPTSTIEVLGTSLQFSASEDVTHLSVTAGRVALIRREDGARIEVPAGRQAEATRSTRNPLATSVLPALPETWEADFDHGLPAEWRCGKWLPESGAVLAHPNPENGYSYFSIASSNAWEQGHHSHFQIHPGSVLHITFKMEDPEWFLVMLNLRATPESVRRWGGNAFYQSSDWHRDLKPGAWRTISLPLRNYTKFQKGKSKSDDADLSGLAVYGLYLSTQTRDRGLVVDRIWVSRES